jgi:hypothetical protein
MPLTAFQREVVRIIAANRSPASHVAGRAVINRAENGLRTSEDLDIFHDDAAAIAALADRDVSDLESSGYSTSWLRRGPTFFQADVRRDDEHLRLEWAADSPFRFFPAVPDDEFGYCLHLADLATNKVLALAGRSEVRDYLDILQLDRQYLSLGAIMWAACGKDQGFTPELLLDQTSRHSRYQETDLQTQNLARPIDLKEFKRQWLEARDRAIRLFEQLPDKDIGCLYLDHRGEPVTPDPASPTFEQLLRHRGSVHGSWPIVQ